MVAAVDKLEAYHGTIDELTERHQEEVERAYQRAKPRGEADRANFGAGYVEALKRASFWVAFRTEARPAHLRA